MINPYLVGKAIYLRPLEKSDAPTLVPWFNDPDINRTLLRCDPMTVRQEELWIEKVAEGGSALVLGVVLKADDRLIGTTGLHQIDHRNRSSGFGIVLGAKEEWGKGYGTEATWLIVKHAFETLNLHRVWLHVYEYNQRGIRAYEKVGFHREGVLRQSYYREGRYWDTIVMAVLREDWEAVESAVP
jgi:RimJ/RimL family protein N-acetyltransferase